MKIPTLLRSVALLGAALLAAPAGAITQACVVKEVRSYSDRVHVRCTSGPDIEAVGFGNLGFINFYAVPTSDWNMALRFTSMASAAVGGVLYIDFDPFVSAAWFGCQDHDCRQALSFWLAD